MQLNRVRGLPKAIDAQGVIDLYVGHATHEQFHAEFKTDLDLELLPSGTLDTNDLMCASLRRRR